MSNFVTAQAAQSAPRYIGISELYSSLTISSAGRASCEGSAEVRSGYTVNLTVELKRDGVSIHEWTASGSGTVTAGGTYYVMSGHDYVVTTTAVSYTHLDVYKRQITLPTEDVEQSSALNACSKAA